MVTFELSLLWGSPDSDLRRIHCIVFTTPANIRFYLYIVSSPSFLSCTNSTMAIQGKVLSQNRSRSKAVLKSRVYTQWHQHDCVLPLIRKLKSFQTPKVTKLIFTQWGTNSSQAQSPPMSSMRILGLTLVLMCYETVATAGDLNLGD